MFCSQVFCCCSQGNSGRWNLGQKTTLFCDTSKLIGKSSLNIWEKNMGNTAYKVLTPGLSTKITAGLSFKLWPFDPEAKTLPNPTPGKMVTKAALAQPLLVTVLFSKSRVYSPFFMLPISPCMSLAMLGLQTWLWTSLSHCLAFTPCSKNRRLKMLWIAVYITRI